MIKRGYVGGALLAAAGLLGCTGDNVPLGKDESGGSGGTSAASGSGGEQTGGTSSGTGGGATGGSGGMAGSGGKAGSGGTSGSGGTPSGPDYQPEDPTQATGDKVDLLLVVDNSISMADKQQLLGSSLPYVLASLANPTCVDSEGQPTPTQPASGADPCPAGAQRITAPVDDLHVGVITSSLGSFGGDAAAACAEPDKNDQAHLVPTLPRVAPVPPTYRGQGFIAYNPSDPEALSDPGQLTSAIADIVRQAGEQGCGYEATLEAAYRFLVDPAPPLAFVRANPQGPALPNGLDTTLLEQRARFLRPDSAVFLIVLSDENDCSVQTPGFSWLVSLLNVTLPRATSQCAADPNDPCCQSCGSGAITGCPNPSQDTQCALGAYPPDLDPANLRCFQQKRRFGIDLLFPTARYAVGFTDAMICPDSDYGDADCQCRLAATRGDACSPGSPVPNPLFAGGRHPSLVSVAAMVGVPWQDLADDPSDTTTFEFLSAPELAAAGRWRDVIGPPAEYQTPLDPFMVESIVPRSGSNPAAGVAISAPGSNALNPINGHEYNVLQNDDLQYACITPLPEPRDCDTNPEGTGCDCEGTETADQSRNPVCWSTTASSYGALQTHAKAYPGIRHLELMEYLGPRGVPASICSPNTGTPSLPNYAHQPAMRAILRRLGAMVE